MDLNRHAILHGHDTKLAGTILGLLCEGNDSIEAIATIPTRSPQKKLPTIREVFDRIFRIARYESEFSENYGSDRYNLWYQNLSGNRDRIKVETNFLLRVPLLKPVKSRKKRLFQLLPLPTVKLLAPEELFATKIVALLARQTARDLYDVDQLHSVSKADLEQTILRTCTIFYGVVKREDFRGMSEDAVALITEQLSLILPPVNRSRVPRAHRGFYDPHAPLGSYGMWIDIFAPVREKSEAVHNRRNIGQANATKATLSYHKNLST